jgi:hypothetical protein
VSIKPVCVFTLLVFPVLATGCVQPDANSGPEDSPALLAPKPKRKPTTGEVWSGTVCEIGPDWFQLAPGWEGSRDTATGTPGWDVKLSEKPKRISTWGTVVGGDPDGELPMFGRRNTHLFTDLKVGDQVLVWCHGDRKEEWSVTIDIRRRPGGKIPPMAVDQWGLRSSTHEEYQSYQDWEEKGTPIPDKFLTDGRVSWLNPPYPPVAPQPREAKP